MILPTLLPLASRIIHHVLVRYGITRDRSFDEVLLGKSTAQIVEKDGSVAERGEEKTLWSSCWAEMQTSELKPKKAKGR